jgi:predicted permease
MEITPLAGRTFGEDDGRKDGTPVVIVNEILAQLFWPGQEAVGKRIRTNDKAPWLEVVGVVKDVKHYGVSEPMRPGVYLPYLQYEQASMAMVVRTTVEPQTLLPALRGIVRTSDSGLAIHDAATMTERLRESLWLRRFVFWATVVMAGVALVLAVGGIYGVIAYATAQRTAELGIRVALGAQRADIMSLVLRHGLGLAGAGIGVGLATALAVAPVLRSLLFGISPFDPITLLAIPAGLTAVALLACWMPARRAADVAPAVALRAE